MLNQSAPSLRCLDILEWYFVHSEALLGLKAIDYAAWAERTATGRADSYDPTDAQLRQAWRKRHVERALGGLSRQQLGALRLAYTGRCSDPQLRARHGLAAPVVARVGATGAELVVEAQRVFLAAWRAQQLRMAREDAERDGEFLDARYGQLTVEELADAVEASIRA